MASVVRPRREADQRYAPAVAGPRRPEARRPFHGGERYRPPLPGDRTRIGAAAKIAAVRAVFDGAVISGSNVFVTNATTGTHAVVNSLGQLSVAATGSVTATPTPPSASYTKIGGASEASGCSGVTVAVPAGKALIVTSITVDMRSVTTGPVEVLPGAATPGTPCGFLTSAADVSISGAGVNQIIPFPSGFPVKAGHVVGLVMFGGSGDANAVVTVNGYLVSSTLCTVTGPPIGCN
jgi:hypothetical protein